MKNLNFLIIALLFVSITGQAQTESQNKNSDEINEFLKQFDEVYLPFNLNEENLQAKKILRLNGLDFLKTTFPNEILYTNFNENLDDKKLPRAVIKLPTQEKFHAFIVYFGENSDLFKLYTLSKKAKIISQITIFESSETKNKTIHLESSIAKYGDDFSLTSVLSKQKTDKKGNQSIKEIITQYKINSEGEIIETAKKSFSSKYYPEISDTFCIRNNGVGNISLGQKVSDIEYRIPDMMTSVRADMNTGEHFRIYTYDIEFHFNFNTEKITKIRILDDYKTEKGIGFGSTFLELKDAYTLEAKLGDTEGEDFIVLKITEMPNLTLFTKYVELPDNVWSLKSDELLKLIPDETKINQIRIEKNE